MRTPVRVALSATLAVVSAGWLLPAALAISEFLRVSNIAMWPEKERATFFEVNSAPPFMLADIAARTACAWLAVVIAGWSAAVVWRATNGRRLRRAMDQHQPLSVPASEQGAVLAGPPHGGAAA